MAIDDKDGSLVDHFQQGGMKGEGEKKEKGKGRESSGVK